jgi:spore germination cell wall hydrolase CwlJ-like protein
VQDIPENELNFVIAMMKADGAIEITQTPQGGGLWTVIGRFPGDPEPSAVGVGPGGSATAQPAPPPPSAVLPPVQSRETAIDTLARTLWGEARGEPRLGKEAVAAVVLNRLKRNAPARFGATIEEVCRKPLQFSCWNPNDPNRTKLEQVDRSDATFAECCTVAELAVDGRLADPTDGADHYHTVNVSPSWSQGKTPCCTIGEHHFFNDIT